MTLPKLIAEVEKLTFPSKPNVLSKLKAAAGLLGQHPEETGHLLAEAEAAKPEPEAPKPDPKPARTSNTKPVKPGSDMPVGG